MPTARVQTLLVSLGVGLATTCLMLATEPSMAIGWDEGYTLGREARLREWFGGLVDPSRFAAAWQPLPLDRDLVQRDQTPPGRNQVGSRWNLLTNRNVLEWFWPFAREEPHGHPPFYALIGLAGDVWPHRGKSYREPDWGRSCSSASRRGWYMVSFVRDGASGRRRWRRVHGFCSQTFSGTGITQPTMPS